MGLTHHSYPNTAADMARAIPGATFTHAWMCDELAGDLVPAFGPDTLVASGTGLFYGHAGPRGGVDRSIGFTTGAATGKFSASSSALFDIASNTDELVVAWVAKWSAFPTAFGALFGKASAAFGNGWHINGNDGTSINFGIGPGSTWSPSITAGKAAFFVGSWHVGIAVIDRSGTDASRIGVRDLAGTATYLSASNTLINGNAASSASIFTLGKGDWVPGNDNFRLAFLAIGKGAGVAAGLAPNLGALLQSFADTVSQAPLVGQYAGLLSKLLPPGKLWRFVGSNLASLFKGASDELVRVDNRVADMLDEADPNNTTELLTEFESELDIDAVATVAERRARIVARLIARQRFRPVDFQTALAPLLAQDPAAVVVIERSRAYAISVGDDREIYRFFIYRNPALPGSYFLASAQALVNQIKPSHTLGYVIESISFLCDDPHSLCDRDLLGA